MRKLSLAFAASALLMAVPAIAAPGNGKAYGHDPKVCLLAFSSAATATSGADAEVVKAQYLPLRIALTKLTNDTQGIGWYGPGELTDDQEAMIDAGTPNFFNYPTDELGTEERCTDYYANIAEQNADDADDD